MTEPGKYDLTTLQSIPSPEKIDQVVKLIAPRHWILLSVLSILFLLIIIWGIVARIPVKVKGRGILINEAGLSEIKTEFDGKVSSISVEVGMHVEKGRVLATVDQAELSSETARLDTKVEEIKKLLELMMANASNSVRAKTIFSLQNAIKADYLAIGINDTSQAPTISATRKRLENNKSLLFELQNYSQDRIYEMKTQIRNLDNELEQKKLLLNNQARIISPFDGTIVEMSFSNGDIFEKGSNFLTIENDDYKDHELIGMVYVNANQGKKIKEGMQVQIAPSIFAPEEYGYLLGTVIKVSKYSISETSMNRALRNRKIVEDLSSEGIPIEIQVRLSRDSSTYSKLKWTTHSGPSAEILSGTLINAHIITERIAPLSFILPHL